MNSTWDFTSIYDGEAALDNATIFSRLRARRNLMLSESDWTQVADAPVDQVAWATYRQALRDLPANTTDPRTAPWPAEPTV